MEGLWNAHGTTPVEIENALRALIKESRAPGKETKAATRVLNLVAIVDREWRGEVENRLQRVGRFHPSRTVICAVEPGRSELDAWATTAGGYERVTIDVGDRHLSGLDTIVNPILVSDFPTVVWSPHGHREAVESLLGLADVVLLDSADDPDVAASLAWVTELAARTYVVDLAWLRSTPWRERIAATFDPPVWRGALGEIDAVTVRHRSDSAGAAVLLIGWLASRLGWEADSVRVELEEVQALDAPGLAGVTVGTASGLRVSLDRGPGGLTATRRTPDGRESRWTVMGASRGESGILAEGVRQALLRDPTYRPALAAAQAFL